MIPVGVQNELRVRQVLLEDERIRRINDHVVAAVHHKRGLRDLLQVSIGIFRRGALFLQCSYLRRSIHRRDYVFLIAAVVADSANLHVCAVHEVSASARKTGAVLPTVPADSNPLAFPPFLHARAHFVDHVGYFGSGDARVSATRDSASSAERP